MKIIKQLDKAVTIIQETILASSILIMSFILILNVIARFIFNNSLTFAEELGQFSLIFITFIGTSYATRKGRHIRMTGIIDMLPKKVKKVLIIFISIITAMVMFYLAFYSIMYIFKMKELGTVSPALRIPLYLVYIVVPIGFTLSGIEFILTVLKNIREENVYVSREKLESSETAL